MVVICKAYIKGVDALWHIRDKKDEDRRTEDSHLEMLHHLLEHPEDMLS